jgi:hypothetical protein
MKTYVNLWQYLAKFFLEIEIFRIKVVEKIKTQVFFSNFPESRALYETMWTNFVDSDKPQATI